MNSEFISNQSIYEFKSKLDTLANGMALPNDLNIDGNVSNKTFSLMCFMNHSDTKGPIHSKRRLPQCMINGYYQTGTAGIEVVLKTGLVWGRIFILGGILLIFAVLLISIVAFRKPEVLHLFVGLFSFGFIGLILSEYMRYLSTRKVAHDFVKSILI